MYKERWWCETCGGHYTHQAYRWQEEHEKLYHREQVSAKAMATGVEQVTKDLVSLSSSDTVVSVEDIAYRERTVQEVITWLGQFSRHAIVQGFKDDAAGIDVMFGGERIGYMVTKRSQS